MEDSFLNLGSGLHHGLPLWRVVKKLIRGCFQVQCCIMPLSHAVCLFREILVKATVLMKVMLGLMKGDTERSLLLIIDYLMAEVSILKQRYAEDCGQRLLLNDEQRRELAARGRLVIRAGHSNFIQLFKPDTLMRWYRRLVAEKYDSSKQPRRPGRPEIPPHVSKLILRIARENRSWGYDRIVGALANLGHKVSDQTVANVLKRHGLKPSPDRNSHGTWKEFIERHMEVMWATDFFTVEVLTLTGLVNYYVLFFIHLETRKVVLGGMTPHPNGEWMRQVARNITGFDGELADAKYLIHDRDPKFIPFDATLPTSLEVVRLPPKSPDLNAYAERFVLSIKSGCINHFIPLGERFLRHIIKEYLAHYHTERNHQGTGIENALLFPDERFNPESDGDVVKSSRLGGMLNFYHREDAA